MIFIAGAPFLAAANKVSSFKTTGITMTDTPLDRANFIIFPPVIPYSTLAIACVLQWLVPLGLVANIDQGLRTGLGALIVIVGMATMFAGHRALLRHGTNVNPLRPTTALVTDGVFRRTRNPLYVGVSVALCGIALIFALDWMLGARSPISNGNSARRTGATRSAFRAICWIDGRRPQDTLPYIF